MINNIKFPLVSVIIVNYNGKDYVERCVRSVTNASYPNLEIIVTDNGSTDGSIQNLINLFGVDNRLKIVEIGENKGPAYARNMGVEIAKGKYIAFLDNDTEPEPNWLDSLVETLENDSSIGACQCKLLLMSERTKLDYAGDYISNLGFLVQRVNAGEEDRGQVDTRDEILSAKSAAMIIRADVVKEIGGFDEDYFIYVEETDLGWRVWLKGYRIIFVPESRVYHEFGTSSIILGSKQNYFAKFHGSKNYITTLIKNMGPIYMVKIVPVHISLWIGMACWLLLKGQFDDSKNIFKGVYWVICNITTIFQKRRAVQRMRVVSDGELMPKIMRNQSFEYFYKKLAKVQQIGNAKGFLRPQK